MSGVFGSTEEGSLKREAYEWLIRLDGDAPLDAEETKALHAWMRRSEAHSAELKRLAGFWSRANGLTELAVPLQTLEEIEAPRTSVRAVRHSRLAWIVVAGALACVMIGFGLLRVMPSKNANGTYGTAVGQQQSLALADGSSIEINTDSQVQVEYSDHLRKIRLLRGEAFFTVAPNPERPFEVYAASGVVRAIGTAFAVSLQGSDVSVTVTKGEVAVSDPDPTWSNSGSASTIDPGLVPAHVSLKAL
jgi:transmembrane sensor